MRSAPTLLDVMGRSPNSAPPAVPMRMAVPGVSAVPKRMAADALMPLAEPGVTRGVLRLLVVEGRSMPAHPVQSGGRRCRSHNKKAERGFPQSLCTCCTAGPCCKSTCCFVLTGQE